MTLSDKYNLAKACFSVTETGEIARKFKCDVNTVNNFKVDLITFIKNYNLETYKVHFNKTVSVREIPIESKNPRKIKRKKGKKTQKK